MQEEKKRYTKKAILFENSGVKKDILNTLLKKNEFYTKEEAEEKYINFLKGGK